MFEEHGVFNVDCPKCSAPAGHRCRTLTTGRTTDTHDARWTARYRPVEIGPARHNTREASRG